MNRAMMDCRGIEELAGAIALGAVAEGEITGLREQLAACEDARALVGELMQVVDVLPYVVEDVEPPARLRTNLLAAVRAEAAAPDAAAPAAVTGSSMAVPLQPEATTAPRASASMEPIPLRGARVPARPRPPLWRRPALWATAAAALLLVAIGLGARDLALQRRLDGQQSLASRRQDVLSAMAAGARLAPITSDHGVEGTVIEPRDGSTAYMVATLPPLPQGKIYQAWVIRNGQTIDAGTVSSTGFVIMPLQEKVLGAQLVALTVEPKGGSVQPTLPMIGSAPAN